MRVLLLLFLLFLIACGQQEVSISGKPDQKLTSDDVLETIAAAYVFGYPLIMMDLTKKVSTNTVKTHPTRPRAPINQLSHFRSFPDPTLRAVVKPNVDTYYSIAWLDLAEEPMILKMPATDRYYLMQFLDGYTNVFASIGTRTTGTDASEFAIVGPDWEGQLSEDLKIYQSSTNMVWMLGRIQTNNLKDGETVVRPIQDSMSVYPLSARGTVFSAPDGTYVEKWEGATPINIMEDLSIEEALNRITTLMVDNPASIRDSTIVNKMARIGLEVGKVPQLEFDNFILKQKLKAIPSTVGTKFRERRATPDKDRMVNNWMMVTSGIGTYDTEYKIRAYISFMALGANLPEDAVYPNTTVDINNNPLDGSKSYVIHMDAEKLPPVKAFWSLTAYNEEEFLIENEINRYAVGSQKDLVFNEDGSLDIHIQAERPTEEHFHNWLPTVQEGPFSLTLRLYWPGTSILNGEWSPPSVIPVEG
ncbi:MAG: hypothetical protein ACJA01_003817 [Saprospiraceae bacterium]|jgi:hypothetical protein